LPVFILFCIVVAAAALLCPTALFVHGRITCWGWNVFGTMGIDSTTDVIGTAAVAALKYIAFSDTIPAVQISLHVHACALFANSRVRCWGLNAEQQLGEGPVVIFQRGDGTNRMAGAVFITFSPNINTIPVINVAVGRYIDISYYIYIEIFKPRFVFLAYFIFKFAESNFHSHVDSTPARSSSWAGCCAGA
jgi:hypothetical protein